MRLYYKTQATNADDVLRSGLQDGDGASSNVIKSGVELSEHSPSARADEIVLAVDLQIPDHELVVWEMHGGSSATGRRWCIPSVLLNGIATLSGVSGSTPAPRLVLEPADPVLSEKELLQIHHLTAGFVRLDTGCPPSLANVQQALADIRLLLSVPEPIRHTFRLAKRLYLFGYFEYGFFTISQHYAFLALEAAVYSRWVAHLPNEITVQIPPNTPYKMRRPTHELLYEHWMASGRKLKVEGADFPNSVHKVLGRFVAEGLIIPEQRERIEAAMQLRNEMSHVETPMIDTPNIGTLAITAEFLNVLFRS